MTEYDVVNHKNINTLISEVDEMLKQGWVCQVGLCTAGGDMITQFYQAMIRTTETKTEPTKDY